MAVHSLLNSFGIILLTVRVSVLVYLCPRNKARSSRHEALEHLPIRYIARFFAGSFSGLIVEAWLVLIAMICGRSF